MYLKAQLERYEAQIPNLLQRQAFHSMMEAIPFAQNGLCLSDSLTSYERHPLIGGLIQDFRARHVAFLRDVDLSSLGSPE